MASTDLAARARAIYERARLRDALLEALWLAPLIAFSLARCRHLTPTCLASVALVMATVVLRYRGGVWGRSVVPAVLASLPALVIPALLPASAIACAVGQAFPSCLLVCPALGLFSGALLGVWSSRQGADRGKALLAGATILLACGTLGCGVFGLAGVGGLLLGASASAPIALLAMRTTASR